MADKKDETVAFGKKMMKWCLIAIAIGIAVNVKLAFHSGATSSKNNGYRTVSVVVESQKLSQVVKTDEKREWFDFDLTDTDVVWYVIVNGDVNGKIKITPNEKPKTIGRGVHSLQFIMEDNQPVRKSLALIKFFPKK